MSRIRRLLDAYADLFAASLEKWAEQLSDYPESQYWQGYERGIRDMQGEEK